MSGKAFVKRDKEGKSLSNIFLRAAMVLGAFFFMGTEAHSFDDEWGCVGAVSRPLEAAPWIPPAKESDEMTQLKLMIGQMVLMGFHGKVLDDPWPTLLRHQIEQGLVGGIIQFAYNIDSPEGLRRLNEGLSRGLSKPLFVAVDQEGGRVQRLNGKNGFHDYVSPQKYCVLTPAQRVAQSYGMAGELMAHGFNLNFAPVVDLHSDEAKVIGQLARAFSEDPEETILCAKDFVAGHHKAGVLTCLKHFPGHGYAVGDSHQGLVDISRTAKPEELIPYQRMIKEGLVDMVMTGHLFNRNIDPDYPATLSRSFIHGILREQMGYEGVVISDDLHMGAIQQHYAVERAVILAIQAGCDMMIFSNNKAAAGGVIGFEPDPHLPEKVQAWVLSAIERGDLTRGHIDAAYGRIMNLKAKAAYPYDLPQGSTHTKEKG